MCWKPGLWDFGSQEHSLGSQFAPWLLCLHFWLTCDLIHSNATHSGLEPLARNKPSLVWSAGKECVCFDHNGATASLNHAYVEHAALTKTIGRATMWDSLISLYYKSPPSVPKAEQVIPFEGNSSKEREFQGSLFLPHSSFPSLLLTLCVCASRRIFGERLGVGANAIITILFSVALLFSPCTTADVGLLM